MIDGIRTRRSIRRFEPRKLGPEAIEILKEALLRAPSSRGFQPWTFVFVDDPGLLARLAAVKPHGASFLAGAPLGIVVCGEPGRSDMWVEDCSIAAILGQLAAHGLGLGSCWIQVRNRNFDASTTAEARVKAVLGLPANLSVECILAVGHPAETKAPVPREDLPGDRIHINGW